MTAATTQMTTPAIHPFWPLVGGAVATPAGEGVSEGEVVEGEVLEGGGCSWASLTGGTLGSPMTSGGGEAWGAGAGEVGVGVGVGVEGAPLGLAVMDALRRRVLVMGTPACWRLVVRTEPVQAGGGHRGGRGQRVVFLVSIEGQQAVLLITGRGAAGGVLDLSKRCPWFQAGDVRGGAAWSNTCTHKHACMQVQRYSNPLAASGYSDICWIKLKGQAPLPLSLVPAPSDSGAPIAAAVCFTCRDASLTHAYRSPLATNAQRFLTCAVWHQRPDCSGGVVCVPK